ncbi:IS3 family transposase [Alkalihalobacillus sp. AL-G]|uniref:IS3 family transposase n=1 Tax=Alkalihalobacillus sp. AL-G TaxID=2926399 RepID=UPI00272C85BA|nr:IS3 family transposase [Alkalihalobacillus sp. AL-G]
MAEYLMELYWDEWLGAMGYKKWTLYLKDHHSLIISKHKVYRMCKGLGILKKPNTKKAKHPRKLARNRTIIGSNQLWQVDIKYGNITDSNAFFYVCSAIDVYDRTIVGYYCGSVCKAKHITTMLTKALIRRKMHFKSGEFEKKLILRTDNGPQFVSEDFGNFCDHHKVYHERIPKKTPDMNAYIESFHSVLQRECFDRYAFGFYEEAFYYVDQYIAFYNHSRYHGSLKPHTPQKYYDLSRRGQIPSTKVKL